MLKRIEEAKRSFFFKYKKKDRIKIVLTFNGQFKSMMKEFVH